MIEILQGDWIDQLKTLPDETIQCCVTSPPYWGLRDYGTASWTGGDPNCDHSKLMGGTAAQNLGKSDKAQRSNVERSSVSFRVRCQKCGATRIDRQLGLEKTPEEYVAKLVSGFREIRRILKNDGTLWLNLGDSYASDFKGTGGASEKQLSNAGSRYEMNQRLNHGCKPKDLVGIPWLTAFALRADGWFLRSEIIWHKPNPMPESVTDRPTKAHEQIFLLSKNSRYFYDQMAICEKAEYAEQHARKATSWGPNGKMADHGIGKSNRENYTFTGDNHTSLPGGNRNKRSVWTVATSPYADAHFATYPPDLIKPCILAGTRPNDTILDPFAGSGTTGMVALELGRKAILVELNPDYVQLIRDRTNVTPGFPW